MISAIRNVHLVILAALVFAGCSAEGGLPSEKNGTPIANAGEDFTVLVGDNVMVSGSKSSDPNGDSLTFRWVLTPPTGSSAALNSSNFEDVEFGADAPGKYRVVLVVSDGEVDSRPDTIIVTADFEQPNNTNNTNNLNNTNNTANRPPVANSGVDQNVQTAMTVQLDGTASADPDGDPIAFDWIIEGQPLGSTAQLSDANAPRPTFVPDVDGDYEISLVVSDGELTSQPAVVFVRAFSNNTPPIANAGADQTVSTGSRVELDGSTSIDADNDNLTYVWSLIQTPTGSQASLNSSTVVTPSFTTDVDGSYVVQLVVNDGTIDSAPDRLTVTSTNANVPPVAHAGVNQNVLVGATVQLDGSMTADANDDAMTYAWSLTTLPQNSAATLTNADTLSPTFVADMAGTYIAQLIADDGQSQSTPATVTITATLANVAPIASAGANQSVTTGDMVILDGTGSSDGDGDNLTYLWSFTAKPAGSTATLDDVTSDIPIFTADKDGTYVLQLIVNDGNVDSVPDSTVVTAAAPANPSPATQGDVIITEIMINPTALADSAGEWFEIYNPSTTQTYNLQTCLIEDLGTDSHAISSSLQIGPGAYITLARNAAPGFLPDYVYSSFQLGNSTSSGDEIILTCGGNEIAQVAYGGALGPTFPIPDGASIQLIRAQYSETANDTGTNWCVSTNDFNGDKGTPGLANEFQSACP